MRAARIHEYGNPDVLGVDDAPVPEPGPRDLLIEVEAAAVNPIDWKIRSGGHRGVVRYRLPHILGLDLSGTVAAIGDQVTRFQVGDSVMSSPTHRRPGTYAEFICVDERAVARKPANLSHQEAATIPLVGLTAHLALIDKLGLQAGQSILIHAGSGGVGTFAIQLAKDLGAQVATTCSGRNTGLVTELGADQVVDYTRQEFDQVLSDCDAVLDTLGGEIRGRSLRLLKPGGRLVSVSSRLPELTERHGPLLGAAGAGLEILSLPAKALLRRRRAQHIVRPCDGQRLAGIADRIEAGAIRPVIDRVYPLEEIAEAHRYSESGHARGKIAIAVR